MVSEVESWNVEELPTIIGDYPRIQELCNASGQKITMKYRLSVSPDLLDKDSLVEVIAELITHSLFSRQSLPSTISVGFSHGLFNEIVNKRARKYSTCIHAHYGVFCDSDGEYQEGIYLSYDVIPKRGFVTPVHVYEGKLVNRNSELVLYNPLRS